jgi:phosphatidylglycerol:prolipoprotein diacylglycerol transferase
LVARHPSQLYEAGLEGVLLFTIVWLYTRQPRPRFMPAAVFLLCYSSARIIVEFVRMPDVQIGYLAGGWFTMGQLLSLPMLLAGLLLLNLPRKWRQPSGNYTFPK